MNASNKNEKQSDGHDKPRPPKVEVEVSEKEKSLDALTSLAIKGGAQIRKKLKLGEDAFSMVYGPSTGNPKKYYLTGVLNEVEKAAMAMMYTADFVSESRKVKEPEITDATGYRIANNSIQVKIDELAVSERKLTEILVDLVGFRRANSEGYYRHYIVLHELDDKKRMQNDMYEYSGIKNKNLAGQIDELEQQADTLAAKLDPDKCWYAKKNKHGLTRNISTFSDRFKAVLPYMKEYQQAALYTYGASFGRQSGLLHSGKPVERDKLTLDTLSSHIGRIGVLAPNVLAGVIDLGRLHNAKGIIKVISDSMKKNDYPIKSFRQRTKPKIVEGDFVVTIWGDLGQVTKVIKSKYGYKSFRVKYLDRLPMPGIPVDDFPAENIRLVYARKPLVEKLRQEILKVTPELKPSTRELNKLMTETVLHLWNNVGLKEFTLKNPKAGYEKIQQEINRINAPKK